LSWGSDGQINVSLHEIQLESTHSQNVLTKGNILTTYTEINVRKSKQKNVLVISVLRGECPSRVFGCLGEVQSDGLVL
jgi:hypothetical protein